MSSSIDPLLTIIQKEVTVVTSTMRRNQRFDITNQQRNQRIKRLDYDYIQDANQQGSSTLSHVLNYSKSQRSFIGYAEHPLLVSFLHLKARLSIAKSISDLDPIDILEPFIKIVKSSETTGPITGSALSAIEKFIKFKVIDPNHPLLFIAMSNLTHSITHCKFEATESVSDEGVLLKILRLLVVTITSEAGLNSLDDKGVCEMVEAAFGMCFQGRVSDLLRKSAEQTLMILVQSLMERLASIVKSGDFKAASSYQNDTKPENENEGPASPVILVNIQEFHRKVSVSDIDENIVISLGNSEEKNQVISELDEPLSESTPTSTQKDAAIPLESPLESHQREFQPFGLASIIELVRVIIALLDPKNKQHVDTMHRRVALDLVTVALEFGGSALSEWVSYGIAVEIKNKGKSKDKDAENDHEKMALIIKDFWTNDVCKYLFQLLQSLNTSSNSSPTSWTLAFTCLILKNITTLYHSFGKHLRLQIEWVIEFIMTKVDAGIVGFDVTSEHYDRKSFNENGKGILVGEAREMYLDFLMNLATNPSHTLELFVYFDGDMKSPSHLFENLIRFLSKNVFPDATSGGPVTSYAHQILCLDSLLLYLKHIVDRITPIVSKSTESSLLMENKRRKRILMECADKFNEKPKEGIIMLQENGFLPTPVDPESLAKILKYTPRINKTLLGDYISKPVNIEILKSFISDFDFVGKRIDEALRLLLESFRLPGESQQIERIMENFAKTYFASTLKDETRECKSEDATFVLAYSVIMLNTDQHNPQVRRRMTIEDFQRNTRGVNDGKNFDSGYLERVYNEIRDNEIVMPEEHEGDLGFNYAWRELIKKTDNILPMENITTNGFDSDMFNMVWMPILESISYEDSLTLQKGVLGFHRCATIVAHYQLNEVFDNIIISLSKITGLLRESDPPTYSRRYVDDVKKPKKKVDRWNVDFGSNEKGQVAAILMFSIVNEHGNGLHGAWQNVVDSIRNLYIHSLLPDSMLKIFDFTLGFVDIPAIESLNRKPSKNKERERRENSTGILSTLSQFLSLTYDDEDEADAPTSRDIEAESIGFECVRSCKVENVFKDCRFLQESSLVNLFNSCIRASYVIQNHGSSSSSNKRISISLQSSNGRSSSNSLRSPPIVPSIPENNSVDALPQQEEELNSSSLFFLEILTNIAIQNKDRMIVLIPSYVEHIEKIIALDLKANPKLVEHTATGLLRLINRAGLDEQVSPRLFKALTKISSISEDLFSKIAEKTMAGLSSVLKSDWQAFCNGNRLNIVLSLASLTSSHPEAAKYSIEITSTVLADKNESVFEEPENFSECVDLLLSFSSAAAGYYSSNSAQINGVADGVDAASPKVRRKALPNQESVERAISALEMLFKLHFIIPKLIKRTEIRSERAWFEYWLPILSGLGQQCYHPSREIRQNAVTHLQRALLLPELEETTLDCSVDCFDNVLFALLDELLKNEVCKLDPHGMDETRMRACGLLCKIFLHYFDRLTKTKEVTRIWCRILDFLTKYSNCGGPILVEGVRESIKNLLLVMSTHETFREIDPSSEADGKSLWDLTWISLESIMPKLKEELFPDVAK